MYTTLSARGSSRHITATRNTRRGGPSHSQPIERFDRDQTGRRDLPPESTAMSQPKPVFNGKRSNYNRQNSREMTQEPITQQHDDSVRFVAEAWSQVKQKYEVSTRQGREGPEYYQEKVPNQMQGFEPFDLDQWWDKRKHQQST